MRCFFHIRGMYVYIVYVDMRVCVYAYMHTSVNLSVCTGTHIHAHTQTMMQSTLQICCTGWQRCIGCLKLQVSFRKRATNYRVLLRKVTYEDKTPYASLPPCTDSYVFIQYHIDINTRTHNNMYTYICTCIVVCAYYK